MTKKIGIVTGAGIRIGAAIAKRLLDDDFHLILHANSSETKLRDWVEKSDRQKQIIDIVVADFSHEDGRTSFVDAVHARVEHIDLLVHNASTFSPKPFKDITQSDLSEMLGVNLEAPFFITQNLLPLLEASTSPSVINILDAMWERPSKNFSHYAVSKAGLAILTRALASELAPNIRVNAVAPGAILFQPFHSNEVRMRTLERIPMQRLGEPEDVAEAVWFLFAKALYATGTILSVDGGRSILA